MLPNGGNPKSDTDIDYLNSLGLAEVIDYKLERFENSVRAVDAVVDVVEGEMPARSYSVVNKGGLLASTVG